MTRGEIMTLIDDEMKKLEGELQKYNFQIPSEAEEYELIIAQSNYLKQLKGEMANDVDQTELYNLGLTDYPQALEKLKDLGKREKLASLMTTYAELNSKDNSMKIEKGILPLYLGRHLHISSQYEGMKCVYNIRDVEHTLKAVQNYKDNYINKQKVFFSPDAQKKLKYISELLAFATADHTNKSLVEKIIASDNKVKSAVGENNFRATSQSEFDSCMIKFKYLLEQKEINNRFWRKITKKEELNSINCKLNDQIRAVADSLRFNIHAFYEPMLHDLGYYEDFDCSNPLHLKVGMDGLKEVCDQREKEIVSFENLLASMKLENAPREYEIETQKRACESEIEDMVGSTFKDSLMKSTQLTDKENLRVIKDRLGFAKKAQVVRVIQEKNCSTNSDSIGMDSKKSR